MGQADVSEEPLDDKGCLLLHFSFCAEAGDQVETLQGKRRNKVTCSSEGDNDLKLSRETTAIETRKTPQKLEAIISALPMCVFGKKSPNPTVVIVITINQTPLCK